MQKRDLGACLVIWCLSSGCFLTAEGATWRVSKDGAGDFSVIYEAVDAAAAGDTIRIGPGLFQEYRYEPDFARETWCCAHITTPDLTLIGSGREETTIGLPEFDPHYEHFVIGISCYATSMTVKDLRVNGVFEGIHFEGPNLLVQDCDLADGDIGVVTWGTSSNVFNQCRFLDWRHEGILSAGAMNVVVQNCEFFGGTYGYAIAGVGGQGYSVIDCHVHDCTGGIQFALGASGVVENCHVNLAAGNPPAIGLLSGAVFTLTGNYFADDGYAAFFATGGTTVTARDNIFVGGQWCAIEVGMAPIDFHQNHIINGGGYSVIAKWEQGNLEEPYVLDMTENYWGTSDPEQIAEWIDDYNDHAPPETMWRFAIVDFEPFAGQPVQVEQHSWSEVKDLFRPGRE